MLGSAVLLKSLDVGINIFILCSKLFSTLLFCFVFFLFLFFLFDPFFLFFSFIVVVAVVFSDVLLRKRKPKKITHP